MRKLTLLTLLLALTMSPIWAQDKEADGADGMPGKWALQFELPDLLSIDQYLGRNLSILRAISDHAALRMGVDIMYDNETMEREVDYPEDDDHLLEDLRTERGISLRIHYRVLRSIHGSSRLYFGGGPMLAINLQTTTDKYEGIVKNKITDTSWYTGAQGIIGVALAIRPRVELFAEYSSEFSYGESVREIKLFDEGSWHRTTTDSYKALEVEPNGALLGVSLYFK